MDPEFTVSILALNNFRLTLACVESVLRHSSNYELILTDNGSVDGTSQYFKSLAERYPFVRVVRNEDNLGFQIPNKRALEIARGRYFVLLNNDTEVPGDWLIKLREPFLRDSMVALSGPKGSCCSLRHDFAGYRGPMFEYLEGSCLMCRTDLVRKHGLFSDYLCVHPSTAILTTDLRCVAAGSLKKGDRLITVDEFPEDKKKGSGRRFKEGVVTGVRRRHTECLKIILDDGTWVISSKDHLWLGKPTINSGKRYEWKRAHALKIGERLCAPFRTWNTETSFDSGWLSGIIDGEGFIRSGGRKSNFNGPGTSVGLGIVQQDGLVLRKAMKLLKQMGIPFIRRLHSCGRNKPVFNLEVFVRKWAVELVGRTRPIRLMRKSRLLWNHRALRSRNTSDAKVIKRIVPIGRREVVSIGTSTRTFIANGIVSHNCFAYGEDSDLSLRMREAGFKLVRVDMLVKHTPNSTSRTVPGIDRYLRRNMAVLQQRWAHYIKVRRMDYPIIVRRMGAIGDVLLTTQIVRALRKAQPQSPLYFETRCPEVLTGNKDLGGIGTDQSNPIGLRVDLDMSYENMVNTHIVDAYALKAGVVPESRVPIYNVTRHGIVWARNLLQQTPNPKCIMAPGPTTWIGKNWPTDKFNDAARWLTGQGWDVILVGYPSHERYHCTMDLRGKTSIDNLAGLMKQAQLFLGVDSFPIHLAQSQGLPAVGVFGATLPNYILTHEWAIGVHADPVRIPCVGERHRQAGQTFVPCGGDCMRAVSVDQVIEAVKLQAG